MNRPFFKTDIVDGPYLILSYIGAYNGIVGEFLSEKPYESLGINASVRLVADRLVLCFLYFTKFLLPVVVVVILHTFKQLFEYILYIAYNGYRCGKDSLPISAGSTSICITVAPSSLLIAVTALSPTLAPRSISRSQLLIA